MKQAVILILAIALSSSLFSEPGKHVIPSILRSAVVYRNAAELTHNAKTFLEQGTNDLIIEDLSSSVDINSIRIKCSGDVTIMSVEFSTEYLKSEIKSPATKKLEDSLEIINKELSKTSVLIKADNDLIDLLHANREIRGTQTGMSVAELMKLMDYYKQKTLELQNELNLYNEKTGKLTAIANKINNEIKEEEQKNTKTSGKLLLQVLSPIAATYDFTISYLTSSAYWNPSYDLRAENISSPIKLSYKAKLAQTSGIDWKQVKLSLSTAVPSQSNEAPILKTWFLKYIDPIVVLNRELQSNLIQSLQGKVAGLQEVVVTGYAARKKDYRSSEDADDQLYIVNGKEISADEFGKIDQRAIKSINVLKDKNAIALYGARAANGVLIVTLKDELGDYVAVTDNQMSVTFDIDIPYDIPDNGKEQNVELKQFTIPAFYKYYSVPKLDNNSYLLAEIPQWQKLNLLPGEANIIFENTYVGKSFIDPNSISDTLNVTLGNDKRVVVKKEKINDYSSVKFLGSNKKQVFTFEITVKNNKNEKMQMLLKDQYPLSSTKDIEVELLDSSKAEVNEETGVLTWRLELAPGENKKVRVSYSIKYPKDKTVNAG
ncbi:MAG TPA: mucoidy inhibitor MuiA family protein [Puia sp.]|nr:mucoidy inhibitor MuiA family protein [Puia sp.]